MGCNRLLADVYMAVAPTLHWNYYAQVGEEYRFTEYRESDLTPLAGGGGGLIMPYDARSVVVKEPVGVVAAFAAFNFGLPAVGQKVAPALMAGCTAIVKVPEPNPLALFAMGDMITEAGFPPGVINIVAAGAGGVRVPGPAPGRRHGELHRLDERRRARSPRSAALWSARACSSSAASPPGSCSRTPTSIRRCRSWSAPASATNAGQSCVCISRILAPRSRYEEIASRLTEMISGLKVGDPREPDTMVRP